MTREEIEGAKEAFIPYITGELIHYNVGGNGEAHAKQARKDLEEIFGLAIKALEQEPRWIPCSEKKPDKGGEYLLWGKIDESEEEDYCFIGDYHEFDEVFGTEISNYDPKTLGFIDTEIEEYYSVVAWMPLPKPYKAETEADND